MQSGIYDKFLSAFAARARAIKVGDPFGTGIDQGPQVSQQQYDRVMSFIDSGKQEGATLYTGGKRVGNEGYFIEPTIFTDVKSDMKIVKEEIFGPVAVVIKFEDDDDVIRQANDSMYGLAAAVFTKNIDRAMRASQKLRAGSLWVRHDLHCS